MELIGILGDVCFSLCKCWLVLYDVGLLGLLICGRTRAGRALRSITETYCQFHCTYLPAVLAIHCGNNWIFESCMLLTTKC